MMNAATLLNIWEQGMTAMPVDRTFLLLSAGYPEYSAEQTAQLSLGEKEAHLLLLREQLFGEQIECVAACQCCEEVLEFTFSAADIGAVDYQPDLTPVAISVPPEDSLSIRPLILNDLLRAGGNGLSLFSRALDQGMEQQSEGDSCSQPTPDQVTAALLAIDPLMDIQLELTCSACGAQWQAPFDTLSYLWAEIERWGENMLKTIHCMAAAYGWSEQEILAMSGWRRQRYMEMIL